MNNNLLQIKIKQRLNKLASFDYDNIECWMIQEAFNKAQLEWVRRQVYGFNTRKEGAEQSTGLIDDLRLLLKSHNLDLVDKEKYYQGNFPSDYLYYVRTDVWAKKDCCPERNLTAYEVEEANIRILLENGEKKPSFEWGETLVTLMGNTVKIYTNGEFSVSSSSLTYYRRPVDIRIQGCVDPSTGNVIKTNIDCEFKDDIAEILVDETVAILAGDIESITQYQRETQNVQQNS